MVHEFGHCFGFSHTNTIDDMGSREGVHIPGTRDQDWSSIMNNNHGPSHPTVDDLKAIQYLYPTLQAAGAVGK